jgi:hypothetical protein
LAILEGASLGRAALLARQQFVQQTAELDPADLKTLGQFSLLGDPSIQPVVLDSATAVPKGTDAAAAARQQRQERRAKLKVFGDFLQDTKPTASKKAAVGRHSPSVKKALANIAREAGIGAHREFTAYTVKTPRRVGPSRDKAAPGASRYFVAVYCRSSEDYLVAAVAREVNARIVGYRIYQEKTWRAMRGVRSESRGSSVA